MTDTINTNEEQQNPQQEENVAVEQAKDFEESANSEKVETEASDPLLEIAALKAQIAKLEENSKNDKDKLIRAVAEADNARKRAIADVERERKYGIEKFVKSLLPIYDSLEKALEFTDRNNEALKSTVEGIESTLNLFLKELKNFGVECINPKGEPFNPNYHQAISMVPSNEVGANCVLHVMQKGFLLNGRVVRAAMVMVAKPIAPSKEENDPHKEINIEA